MGPGLKALAPSTINAVPGPEKYPGAQVGHPKFYFSGVGAGRWAAVPYSLSPWCLSPLYIRN
jgi:hypothetical protein